MDAGFLCERELPKQNTGVLIGNTLTGEFSRASVMRLRWPFVQHIINHLAKEKGWEDQEIVEFLLEIEKKYKKPFSNVTEETLAGSLSNTIAGRICNYYDFKGGGYTLDGACSSSLLAVVNACNHLIHHQLDVAIVGGVDLSLDPFELVGFAKTQALSKSEMKIFDKNSNGFWPGEGCGFVVLTREEYAIKKGFNIYSTITGWGVSSDGKGGLTRPEVGGQTLALKRAYKLAGYSVDDVHYFECHGTGTKVGDTVELTTLSNARTRRVAYIGSIKGNIGHTKAAAGIAGMIKAVMAISKKVIPPITGCENPHEILESTDATLKISDVPLPWDSSGYLRAGVSSMGFGGINVHIALESIERGGKSHLSNREHFIASSYQDTELLLFTSETLNHLKEKISLILAKLTEISYSELPGLSQYLFNECNMNDKYRAAILVSTPSHIEEKLTILLKYIANGVEEVLDTDQGIYISKHKNARIGFLFPGQAAPVKANSGIIERRFQIIKNFYDQYPDMIDGDRMHTSNAQPNIIKATLASLKLLNTFNIHAGLGIGHSLGELSALYWSKSVNEKDIIELSKIRGQAMSLSDSLTSMMASIICTEEEVNRFINDDVVIACYNSKNHYVISGGQHSVKMAVGKAKQMGFVANILPVSHGFHSPYMSKGKKVLEEFLESISITTPEKKVISTVTGDTLDNHSNIKELLVNQLTEPVLFAQALDRLKNEDIDFFIEVGPGTMLNSLVSQQMNIPVVSIKSESPFLKNFLNVLALAFVKNSNTDLSELYNRFIRPFHINKERLFFSNPCEQIEKQPIESKIESFNDELSETDQTFEDIDNTCSSNTALELLKLRLSEKLELPIDSIHDGSRMLDDLHMNSITVGQIVAEVANAIGVVPPLSVTEFANATVKEIADLLENQHGKKENFSSLEGVLDWVGAFAVDQKIAKDLCKKKLSNNLEQQWEVVIPQGYSERDKYIEGLSKLYGRGIIFVLPPFNHIEHLKDLLNAAKKAVKHKDPFVIIQQSANTCSSFAKSFFLETNTATCVISVPSSKFTFEWIQDEIIDLKGFKEVAYNDQGVRSVPVLKPVEINDEYTTKLSSDDVLLFTGGGKGIAAECALSLAMETGSKLAIIGRSHPERDPILKNTLKRAEALGIEYCYQAADITNKAEVDRAIQNIQSRLGTITGFTQAAGINKPILISNLEIDDFIETVETKYLGTKHVLDCLDKDQLKFFVAFSSIIGRAGLHGESHYAVSNEWLTNLTCKYGIEDNVKSLSIEWSVWSGLGMGSNLGVLDLLKQQGITPIPIKMGVKLFTSIINHLLGNQINEKVLVVSGRMGNIPTLEYDYGEQHLLRFVEEVKLFYPHNEIIVDIDLSKEKDPYLHDHILENNMLFPAVMSLEAMAQSLYVLTGRKEKPSFKSVKFNKPIIVDTNNGERIRVSIVKRSQWEYKVMIFTQTTNFSIAHCEGVCVYRTHHNISEAPLLDIDIKEQISIDTDKDMYQKILFQKGRFQRIQKYLRLSAFESLAVISNHTRNRWFDIFSPQELLLGDPGVTDACIHSLQACIPHKILIPVRVETTCYLKSGNKHSDYYFAYGMEVRQQEDLHVYNLYIYDDKFTLSQIWLGLELKEVGDSNFDFKPVPLLSPYIERKLRTKNGIKNFRLLIEDVSEKDLEKNNMKERIVYQLTGEDIPYMKMENGMPVAKKHHVSFSDRNDILVGISSSGIVGCDVEKVQDSIHAKTWQTMLGDKFIRLAEKLTKNVDHKVNLTKIWSVIECVKKAGLSLDSIIEIEEDLGSETYFKMASAIIGTYLFNNVVITILVERE